ncbi:hypothetical protein V501_06306 [Pseudogymnoascus sp. VKM F-4519 (FW-2642)]|nr:hypothetical protein V501_06306 [Pseudogymnoascus sp. VKM F-4519 (FW-2642)]
MARELFEALESAVQESIQATESVREAVTKLKSAWSIAEPRCTDGVGMSFETWALKNTDVGTWSKAMSILYDTEKRIKDRAAIMMMAKSLQILPCKLYATIEVQVLSSDRGINGLKKLIELFDGKLEPMVLYLQEARGKRLGGETNRKPKDVHFTISDVNDAKAAKQAAAAKAAKQAAAVAAREQAAEQAATVAAREQAATVAAREQAAEQAAAVAAREQAATVAAREQAAEQAAAVAAREQARKQAAAVAAQEAAAAAKARAEKDTTQYELEGGMLEKPQSPLNTLEMAKRKLIERKTGNNARYKRLKPHPRASSVPPMSTSPYTEERATGTAQPTQSEAKPSSVLCPAQIQQDALFNDERRHTLFDAYRRINAESPNTHLARVGQLAIHIFEFGRPARVWTAGGKGSERVGFSTNTISIHGGCDCDYDSADILLLTEAQHAIWATNNNNPKLIVIRDHEFIKRRPAQTTQDWLKEMEIDAELSPRTIKIDVQLLGKDANNISVENMEMQNALTLWKNADTSLDICVKFPPVNFLNISNPGFTCWPKGITKHYGLLRKAVGYCESVKYSQNGTTEINIGKPTSLPFSHVDIQKCLEFSIAAQRGAVSGWHMDQNGVTTFLILERNKSNGKLGDEVKYWPFIPMDQYGVEEQDTIRGEFKKYGEQWRPKLGGGIPVIALLRGDTLIQPPGTIHAPITLTNCKLTGGMAWREQDLKRSLKEWLFLADNEGCTNEPLPKQTQEIINYLQPWQFQEEFMGNWPTSGREETWVDTTEVVSPEQQEGRWEFQEEFMGNWPTSGQHESWAELVRLQA